MAIRNNNNFHVQQWENEFWDMIQRAYDRFDHRYSSMIIILWYYLLTCSTYLIVIGGFDPLVHLWLILYFDHYFGTVLIILLWLFFFFVISSLLPDVICFITTKYFLVVLLITNISNSRYMVRLFYLNIFGVSDPCYLFQYSYIFSPCILIMNIFRIYLDHGLF